MSRKPSSDTIIIVPTRGLLRNALSRNLYQDAASMVGELLTNGIDAATRRGVTPELAVRFWAAGEHPLSQRGPAISVLDNGIGFTPEVVRDYGAAGESAHAEDSSFHGTHGLGKFAAFGLSDTDDPVFYITTSIGGSGLVTYTVRASTVFGGGGIVPEAVTAGSRPGLPDAGPFSEIFIPNFNGSIRPEELCEQLTNVLPIRPWAVTVQGEPVAARSFSAERRFETVNIPAFGGTVRIDLATAEVTGRSDDVWLVDSESGRIVGSLSRLPAPVRRHLKPILTHPRLQGEIRVPRIEKSSNVGRAGLRSDYWRSRAGQALLRVLNLYGVQEAEELLSTDKISTQPFQEELGQVASAFLRAFGEPEPVRPGERPPKGSEGGTGGGTGGGGEGGGGEKPPGGRPGGPRGPKGGGGGSDPSPPRGRGSALGVPIKIEGMTYLVMSFACGSRTPAQVRSGNVIVIDVNHAAVKRLSGVAATRRQDELVRAVIEAHVAAVHGSDTDIFGKVYELVELVRASPTT